MLTRLRPELPIEEKWRASLAAEQLMIIATLENNSNWARHVPTPLLPLWSTPTARLELYNTYDALMTLADTGADQLSTRSRQWEESFVRQGDRMRLGPFFPAIHLHTPPSCHSIIPLALVVLISVTTFAAHCCAT